MKLLYHKASNNFRTIGPEENEGIRETEKETEKD